MERLRETGWKYVEAEKLERVSFDEPLLMDVLKKKLLDINRDIKLVEDDLNLVVNKLKSAFTDQNGHREILRYFKYGVPIKTEKEKIVRYIQLFDHNNREKNEFFTTNQFEFSGKEKIRLDVLLFVNGIPVVNIECKNPYTGKTNYYDAYKQIKRYEKAASELYKYVQIGIACAERVKYFPVVPWLEDVKQEVWRWDDLKEDSAIFEMLRPDVLLDIMKDFIFVREFRGEMTKVIGRYIQYRAANKLHQRVMDNLEGRTDKNRGLIWHWQGSGKTLTMIFAAHKLFFRLGKPTILFIVDRRDLERQFSDELSSLDLNFTFEKIETMEHLKEVLTYDNYKGKRGVFLTLIHKFNLKEDFILEQLQQYGEIRRRKDIICFLDEVHRSQYGILAMKMKNVLENSFFFGFTGTPISCEDRDTYEKFGYMEENDPEPYLDKYFIDEAEKDGFVLPVVYELRKEEVHLRDYDLEWYFQQVEADDISDAAGEEEIRNAVRERIDEISVFLENPKNIEVICKDIARHFKENFDGRFKGLVVTGSRKACVRFKNALDKYLPPEYSEVVMTFDREEKEINQFQTKLVERFKKNDTEEIVKEIIEKFRKEDYPRLLIVTDMLITGFDEPKLAVLYLYKILKNHRLLQTIARVNRPFKEKPAGILVDYVGVFKYIAQAFRFYSSSDVQVIRDRILEKKEANGRFSAAADKLKHIFGKLAGCWERECFDRAVEILEEKGDEFARLYRELRRWFEFLKTEKDVLSRLTEYKWFSALYEYYKKLLKPDIDEGAIEKYFQRTINLIHEVIEPTGLKTVEPRAIDLNYVKQIKNSNLTQRQKTIGILTALQHICVLRKKNPIYKSIAQKVKELVEKWQQKEIALPDLSTSIDDILKYIEQKEEERTKTKLTGLEFGIKVILEEKLGMKSKQVEHLAEEIYGKIKDNLYPGWNQNPAILKLIDRKIREFLSEVRSEYKLPYDDFVRLHKDICDFVESYEPQK